MFTVPAHTKEQKLVQGLKYLEESQSEWPLKLDTIHLPYKSLSFSRNEILDYINEKKN